MTAVVGTGVYSLGRIVIGPLEFSKPVIMTQSRSFNRLCLSGEIRIGKCGGEDIGAGLVAGSRCR